MRVSAVSIDITLLSVRVATTQSHHCGGPIDAGQLCFRHPPLPAVLSHSNAHRRAIPHRARPPKAVRRDVERAALGSRRTANHARGGTASPACVGGGQGTAGGGVGSEAVGARTPVKAGGSVAVRTGRTRVRAVGARKSVEQEVRVEVWVAVCMERCE